MGCEGHRLQPARRASGDGDPGDADRARNGEHPVFDDPKPDALQNGDIANAVLYALAQPPSVDVHELPVLPAPRTEG